MAQLIMERDAPHHQIATVWHPLARGEVVQTNAGFARVAVGSAAYQLTTGEIVKV